MIWSAYATIMSRPLTVAVVCPSIAECCTPVLQDVDGDVEGGFCLLNFISREGVVQGRARENGGHLDKVWDPFASMLYRNVDGFKESRYLAWSVFLPGPLN
jgi:hypothetical protein